MVDLPLPELPTIATVFPVKKMRNNRGQQRVGEWEKIEENSTIRTKKMCFGLVWFGLLWLGFVGA